MLLTCYCSSLQPSSDPSSRPSRDPSSKPSSKVRFICFFLSNINEMFTHPHVIIITCSPQEIPRQCPVAPPQRRLRPLRASTCSTPISPRVASNRAASTDKLELDGSFVRGDETALHVRAAMRAAAIIWIRILTMLRRLISRPIHKISHINLTQQSNGW
jgi:hypothetical protein